MSKNINDLKLQEERQLVRQALASVELSWKQILVRHKSVILNAIKSHTSKFRDNFDQFKVEDIYQEVLVKLHRSALQSFLEIKNNELPLSAFLHVVALNTAKDYTKSKLGQASLQEINPEISEDDDSEFSLIDLVMVEEKTPVVECLDREAKKILLEELVKLPADKQEIIRLFLWGESNTDIASKVGKTSNYVNKCVFNFKEYLEKKYSKADEL